MTPGQDARLNSLARRVSPLANPERLLNPAVLSSALPRRPSPPPPDDGKLPTQLCRSLDLALAKPVKVEPFVFDPALVRAARFHVQPRMLTPPPSPSRVETSSNWSGAYVTANGDNRFLQVWGVWTIPGDLKAPPSPFQGQPGIEFRVANWIGLDGQRRYFNSSLPQIGTASFIAKDGTTKAEAWVQWFERGSNDPNLIPLTLQVEPGQQVLCVVTVLDPQRVACIIINLSAPVPVWQALCVEAPPVKFGGGVTVAPSIAGATAEWIVERPQVVGSATPNNFPDYGQTGFDFCIAMEGRHADLPSLLGGTLQDLSRARPIRMYERLTGPSRTRYISMPRKIDNLALQVRYGGFK